MPPQTPSIHLLPPPGPSVLLLSTAGDASPKSKSTVPQLFLAAHKVRFEVFVTEQHCSAASEIDADDATSWHWVIFAPRSAPPPSHDQRAWLESLVVQGESPEKENDYFKNNNNNNNKGEDEKLVSEIPVGTIRLIPFSHSSAAEEEEQPTHAPTKMWNGKEAYIKLGRLATLRSHRRLGFGKVLVDTALKWAVENAVTLGQPRRRPRGGEEASENNNTAEEEGRDGGWHGLVLIHAQRDVEGWYRRVAGFVTDEGLGFWIEEGIEHVGMWRRLDLE